jgi:aspartyl/asparaginyl beta-hydroxylase (cupin superfamily)
LSIAPVYYQAEPFQELWQEMIYRLRKMKLPVSMSRQNELQSLIGNEERLSRELLMDTLVTLYPELEVYARTEKRNRNKYYYKMFEAVAAATLYQRRKQEE